MTVYICDDDITFAKKLEEDLHKLLSTSFTPLILKVCSNGQDLLRLSGHAVPDLVFLDIDMPGMDGFTLARQLSNANMQLLIVFVTSINELVFQSFLYHPFWFLRKAHMEELTVIVKKLVQRSKQSNQAFLLTIAGATRAILLSEILYFESNGHYVNLYLTSEKLRYKEKISHLEHELASKDFVRIHMGYLVNCRHIKKVDGRQIMLDNGCVLPVSRNHLLQTQCAFMRYMRSAL